MRILGDVYLIHDCVLSYSSGRRIAGERYPLCKMLRHETFLGHIPPGEALPNILWKCTPLTGLVPIEMKRGGLNRMKEKKSCMYELK
jgi:hypothetical protein